MPPPATGAPSDPPAPHPRPSKADPAAALRAAIDHRAALVGILGLGYVGLPLALVFAERGFRVLGFDIDPQKVATLDRGECYIRHIEGHRIAAMSLAGRFAATSDFDRLAEADALLICVPTPLTAQREPDLSFVVETTNQIAERLRSGQLVVLESTTYPGTTDEVVRGILDRSGLALGVDYFLEDYLGEAVLSAGFGRYQLDLQAQQPPEGLEDGKFGWYVSVGQWFAITRRSRITLDITVDRCTVPNDPVLFSLNAALAFSF